jgi:hypothetical protein
MAIGISSNSKWSSSIWNKTEFGLLVMLCIFFVGKSQAQLRINEVLASNASVNIDKADSAYSDWIEIYNGGTAEVNLGGYYLTDNFDNVQKWQFPTGTMIAAQGYLLVWCDDKGSGGLHTNFKLSADGEQVGLYSPTKEVVDTLSFGAQFVDVSYGRLPQDPSQFRFFLKPTPEAPNNTEAFTGYANQPEILTLGGFFNAPLQVEITQDLGGKVHYTLDGSEPTASSPIYSGAISISKTTVLRARIIQDGLMPGKIVTETYFINEGFDKHQLPVVSLATDAANFWDSKKGIYTQTFKPDWEVPVNIELFENNGSDRAAFNEAAGVKINGLYSWQLPQKMLGVYFKKQYGEGKLSYQLFFDNARSTFDNFALRASGNDWSNTLFRDGLVQQACRRGNTNLELMAFRPCVVYVNGAFLGIHNIREKVDDDYISSNKGIKKGTFDMIEGGDYAETGDFAAWDSLSALTKTDLSQQANFDSLSNCFDVENFTDYIVTELYSKNTSISHNTMAWKPKGSGKWRWVLMDTDRGFFGYGGDLLSYYMDKTVWPLAKMMKNASYKTYLCQRIANQLFTTFNPITVLKQIDEHQKDIAEVMPQHIARWLGTTSSYGDAMPSLTYWYNEVEKLRTFASGRPELVLQDLMNYGCEKPATLSLSSYPDNACTWLFNQMKVDEATWFGRYPQNMPITLTAVKKAGYDFKGWRENKLVEFIPKESTWSYLDDGTNQGTAWKEMTFDDSAWKSGNAPLGYSISNIRTIVSYGSSSSNKYITTYFRKHFTVDTPLSDIVSLKMNVQRDDGAVVYLNGKKILSTNMPATEINYKTLAPYACGDLAGTSYLTFNVPVADLQSGDNVFAVEVHQAAVSSSDLAFDLQFLAETKESTTTYFSTDETCSFSLQGDRSITAVYASNGQNLVPDSINSNMVFYKARSPYIVPNDVYIKAGATLTIEPGVQVWMAPQTHFFVHGSIHAQGLPTDSILFRLNPAYGTDKSWGALCFIHATDTTRLSYLELRDATNGPKAYNCVAAISAFDAVLRMDHILLKDIDSNPIAARYSDVKLTNSDIHSEVLGDLINVKYGKGAIDNCRFVGNRFPDTDGIDFDGVKGGTIHNVSITNFEGSNSDAVDLGERSTGVRIDSLTVYNITDKGVSVGQRSSAILTNSIIVKTTLGAGVKDSSSIAVDHCTFYGVATPIACYEKVFGRAGGNAMVTNSILSNSYDQTILCDDKSQVYVAHSISDNDTLPAGHSNIFGDPGFVAPGLYDLRLRQPYSPTIGSTLVPVAPIPEIAIAEICYNTSNLPGRTEYLRLYNPGDKGRDISGYTLSKAVELVFPQGCVIPAHGSVYVAKNKASLSAFDLNAELFEWSKGSLANEGEAICLSDSLGLAVDQVVYSPSAPWPDIMVNGETMTLVLSDYTADNHLAKYWQVKSYPTSVNSVLDSRHYFTLNSRLGTLTMHLPDGVSTPLEVYALTGQKIISTHVTDGQIVNLSSCGQKVLMVSVFGKVEKVAIFGK